NSNSKLIELIDGNVIRAHRGVVRVYQRWVGGVGIEKNRTAQRYRRDVIFSRIDQDAGKRHFAASIRYHENGKGLRRQGIHFYRLRDLRAELLEGSTGSLRLGRNCDEKTSGVFCGFP